MDDSIKCPNSIFKQKIFISPFKCVPRNKRMEVETSKSTKQNIKIFTKASERKNIFLLTKYIFVRKQKAYCGIS